MRTTPAPPVVVASAPPSQLRVLESAASETVDESVRTRGDCTFGASESVAAPDGE